MFDRSIYFIRNHIVLVSVSSILCVILLVIFVWLFNTSRIFLEAQNNPAKSEFSFNLLNQADNKSTQEKSTAQSIVKTVSRSSYEALITQQDYSFFAVSGTSGFFAETQISGNLIQEKSRTFVGNNPGSCLNLLDSILVSYQCGDLLKNVNIHVPATSSTPTYTVSKSKTPIQGNVEGIITTSEGNLALINTTSDSPQGLTQTLYLVNNSLEATSSVNLGDLNPHYTYTIKPYKDGFIVYDKDWKNAYYYTNSQAKPSIISLPKPDDKINFPIDINFQKNSVVTMYSDNTSFGNSADSSNANENVKTQVILSGDTTGRFNFNGTYQQAIICGTAKLCLVGNNSMEVYDISTSSAHLFYKVINVNKILPKDTTTLVITNTGVLDMKIDSAKGFLSYSFGPYKYSAITQVKGGYVLSLTNSKNESVALYINESENNTDSIDKKIAELRKSDSIQSLSIYRNKIFITPNVGELVNNIATNSFSFDQTKVAQSTAKINQLIKDLGINTSTYSIIYTIQ